MSSPTSHRLAACLLSLAALACWTWTAAAFGQAAAQTFELRPGETVERVLTGAQAHESRVELGRGEFIHLRAEQKGVDLVLGLHAAGGELLAEMDSPNGNEGFETLSFVAEEAGVYLVRVRRLERKENPESGGYRLTLAAKRAATAADRRRVEAERRLFATFKNPKLYADLRKAQEEFESLAALWREVGDDYVVGFLESILGEVKKAKAGREEDARRYSERRQREEAVARSKAEQEARRSAAEERRRARDRAAVSAPRLTIPSGHSTFIQSVAFSPDGKLIASATGWASGSDRVVKLWDVAAGREIKTLAGHTDDVHGVAFSPDGRRLASASGDDTVKLWDVATGQELASLKFGSQGARALAFSPDGLRLAAAGYGLVKVWDAATGGELKSIAGGSVGSVRTLAFSADGKSIATGNFDKVVSLWDATTGKALAAFKGHQRDIITVAFAPDGRTLASGDSDGALKLWDVAAGRELWTIRAAESNVQGVAFAPDGKTVVVGYMHDLIGLFDAATGRQLRAYGGERIDCESLALSRDGRTIAVGDFQSITLFDAATAEQIKSLEGYSSLVQKLILSPDGRTLALDTGEGLRWWDLATGQERRPAAKYSQADALAFSPDGRVLAGAISDIDLYDVATGRTLATAERKDYGAKIIAFAPDGRALALVNGSMVNGVPDKIELWDVAGLKLLRTISPRFADITSVAFSPDGRTLATAERGGPVTLWEVSSGREAGGFKGRALNLAVAFSPDGKRLAAAQNHEVVVWDLETGREARRLVGHTDHVEFLSFSPDGRTLASEDEDQTVKFWDVAAGREVKFGELNAKAGRVLANVLVTPDGRPVLADLGGSNVALRDAETEDDLLTLVALEVERPRGSDGPDAYEWGVVDPDGRWDASEGAQKLMYYTVATPEGYEVIEFSQLKERYYEPNLLPKLLGHSREPLRDVARFRDVLLPPAVSAVEPADPSSTVRQVRLRNRKGGIGRVQVFVNGREFIEDARDARLKSDPHASEYLLSFDLRGASVIAGEPARVRVVAWNYDERARELFKGYVSSRGVETVFQPPGEKAEPPALYAIIGGVSDYAGDVLDLRFAAKDAEDIYQAVRVGGRNLFGVERMKLKLLATGRHPDAAPPTKENFRRAFAEFAAEARPGDILFVYLAGHGITINAGSDTYYYLTQQATTNDTEALGRDSELLSGTTVNSEELTQWHKSVKALKQVLILDTCAAGALGRELNLLEKRELSSDAKRAVERMRTRVGFHVLMGSASDAASYEASQYGQGLLTYSLLQGMRGAALQADGQVDVSRLFNYAADAVPALAQHVGGIQRPEIRVPAGGASFAIGLLASDEDRRLIPLAQVRPVVLRPSLQNRRRGFDDLKLESLLRARLRGAADQGLVFVDADAMPGAVFPSGHYTVEGVRVRVRLNLILNDEPAATVTVEGHKDDLPALAEKIVKAVADKSRKLGAAAAVPSG